MFLLRALIELFRQIQSIIDTLFGSASEEWALYCSLTNAGGSVSDPQPG